MKRPLFIMFILLIGTSPLSINAVLNWIPSSSVQAQAEQMVKDGPPDLTHYTRKAVPDDYGTPGRPALPKVVIPQSVVRDVVVSNTNPNLTNTDTFGDSEPTIAINPQNTNEIVISAFSGGWPGNTPIWHSLDGGLTWTKQFTIPAPPGDPSSTNCPCDQAFDYGRGNQLAGTFLTADVFSGITTNPANTGSWNWLLNMGVAQRTNSAGIGNVDQPWLLYNRDTAIAAQDNVYVAYDDFSMSPLPMRVAVSLGTNPPNFTRDNQSGTATGGGINPGHRLAVDSSNGFVYSLFQSRAGAGDDNTHNVNYMLNRSTDGGVTWGLNGAAGGITVANADSMQACPSPPGCGMSCVANPFKFGTVNALLGGVDHAAVNPNNGDIFYVYGNRDAATNNNRLGIRRLTSNGMGGVNIGAEVFVTGQVQAALPSVAVSANGTVGVLYTQYDGMSGGGIPMFSAHFVISTDSGATFPTDIVLENFLSSATDSGACRQRVLGDYQQVKAVGNTFYGVFTGNGVPFGRPFANHDPIFFRVPLVCEITCPANITTSNNANQCGAVINYPAPTTLSCGTVSCNPASGSFFPVGVTTVTCTTEAGPSCNFTITVNDTQAPTIACPANITRPTDPGLCSAVVTYPNPTVSDNCPNVGAPNCAPPSGSIFPKGVTTVNCSVADASGNTANCSFTITVNDTEPPVIVCPNNIIAVTVNPGDACVPVNFIVTAADNCPGVTFVCVNDANPAQIITSGFCFPTVPSCTTIRCTATDTSGNTAVCTFRVCVFDVRLQDDNNSLNEVLFNSFTGDYVFCCNGTSICGKGVVSKKGQTYNLTHNTPDRRVLAYLDNSLKRGNASRQVPPGAQACAIQDRDITNDTLTCNGACVFP